MFWLFKKTVFAGCESFHPDEQTQFFFFFFNNSNSLSNLSATYILFKVKDKLCLMKHLVLSWLPCLGNATACFRLLPVSASCWQSCCSLQSQTHGLYTRGVCVPCHCNSFGSKSFDCDEMGQCRCQPGVTGPKCDRCARGFFNFQEGGCTRKRNQSGHK